MSSCVFDGDVVSVTMFSLLPGVDPGDFEKFSVQLDRPACMGFAEIVKSFDVFRVAVAPDGEPADIVEVMHVADWAAWEQIRDHDAALAPVMKRFIELVDTSTIRTWLTHPLPATAG